MAKRRVSIEELEAILCEEPGVEIDLGPHISELVLIDVGPLGQGRGQYWGPNGGGYTSDLQCAGVYLREDAAERISHLDRTGSHARSDHLVPLVDVLAAERERHGRTMANLESQGLALVVLA
jgi:hypothetical protein